MTQPPTFPPTGSDEPTPNYPLGPDAYRSPNYPSYSQNQPSASPTYPSYPPAGGAPPPGYTYPPQVGYAPALAPPAPPSSIGYLAICGLIAAAFASLLYAWQRLSLSQAITDYEAGMLVTPARLTQLDERASLFATLGLVATIVTGITTIIWLYQSRRNVEAYGHFEFRRGRGWAIGSWFCPIVNLWFPFQCVADVVVASRPATVSGVRLKDLALPVIVVFWWIAWLGSTVSQWFAGTMYGSAENFSQMRTAFIFDYVSVGAEVVAAGCLIAIILAVARDQRLRYDLSRQAAAASYYGCSR